MRRDWSRVSSDPAAGAAFSAAISRRNLNTRTASRPRTLSPFIARRQSDSYECVDVEAALGQFERRSCLTGFETPTPDLLKQVDEGLARQFPFRERKSPVSGAFPVAGGRI
jgi:hypothetical protein